MVWPVGGSAETIQLRAGEGTTETAPSLLTDFHGPDVGQGILREIALTLPEVASGTQRLMVAVLGAWSAALGLRWPTRLVVAGLVAAGTLVATDPYNFYRYVTVYTYPDWRFVRYQVGRDRLRIPACQAAYLQTMQEIVRERLTPAEDLLIAPCEAGLYPILDPVSPVWNTYFVYPELAQRQQRMIRELQEHSVRLALVNDALAIDGKEAYRFHASNPLLWRYLTEHFQPVPESRLPAGWQLLERKPSEPGLSPPGPGVPGGARGPADL
jgi:hypothetical protein